MKQDALTRLLQSAAKAPREELEPISNVLENRIVNAWKRGGAAEDEASLIPIFRWGFALSMLTACLALAAGFQSDRTSVLEEVQASVSTASLNYYP
jgi:hypothetical protein